MSAPAMALASALTCPTPLPGSDVRVQVVSTGQLQTRWELVDDSGREGPASLPLLVGEIRHPAGMVLVDAGLGQATRDGEYPRFPLSGDNADIPTGATVAERYGTVLKVLVTHLHYDHVGGLLDLQGTEVWTTSAEWNSAASGNLGFPEVAMKRAVNWKRIDLRVGRSAQVLGRPAVDVMQDGTIWYLSTPGHTPGSASVLVRTESEAWLFIGDIAWVDAHLMHSRRPSRVALVVDGRPRQLRESLQWARGLKKRCPDLHMVAGHEPRWAELP